ncbi:MAG: ina [Blastococcus sp.]|nr:ina [Blastococcus sp.]
MKRAFSVALGVALLAAVPATAADAAPPENAPETAPARGHDLSSPLADEQRDLRTAAVEKVLTGKAEPKGANKVVEVSNGEYVELSRVDDDAIWTVLGEFSDLPHNSIPAPDRKVDNTTIWTEDFSQAYFQRLLHDSAAGVNSVANFYEELSSGRYTVTGTVEDWTEVPGTGASYGANDLGDAVTWRFVNDTMNGWYADQRAAGRTVEEIDAYLSQFDVWDRYDVDDDGDFQEADGYIDHFQAVHSGMGEEVGGGVLGEDAIWSHRWYNQTTGIGDGGPTLDDGREVLLGGARVGESKYWVGDYTVEPENGGVGVFAHEFGHDLGLPDLYDTSGNSGGAENSTAFWTLMSSGSYGNSGRPEDGIGTKPIHMGAWEKFQLGWLDFVVVPYGERAEVKLGPATHATDSSQALIALLPDKPVTTIVGTPFEGADFWYSGSGDDLDTTMLSPLPADAATMTAKVKYQIEQDWDYAYAGYSSDGGKTFTSLATNLSTDTDPNGQNSGAGITGTSGDQWVDLVADVAGVPAGALVGFRYRTDSAYAESGLQVDAVAIDGTPVTSWTLDGFTQTTGTATSEFFNAYIAENRAYTGYDAGLRTGPYNFGDPGRPDWAEHLPYQDGLLISYWNEQYSDNNVGAHPGGGLILPIDAHADLLYEPTADEGNRRNRESWRPRVQSFDSTFGLDPTDRFTLHDPDTGVAGTYGGLKAVPVFDDRKDWYVEPGSKPDANGWTGVDVPRTGTKITVVGVSADRTFMQVRVN